VSNPEGTGPRVRSTSMRIEIRGDELARNVSPYTASHSGQVQITDPDYTWVLHISGTTPDGLRHLAKVIADAGDDLERQLVDQAAAHYVPMAEQAAAQAVSA